MPLPQNDTPWPPQQVESVYKQICLWDAWYQGDPGNLETQYAITANRTTSGLWGGLRRMFWGTPNPAQVTQPPVKIHAPIASEIARMGASLLFGEMFAATFEDDDDSDDQGVQASTYEDANKRLAELLDDNAHARLLEAAEFASAHGGSFVKIAWDKSVHADGPFLVAMAADTAVPEFRFGQLTAVTFWSTLAPISGQAYTLLERHEPGFIEFGLYESSSKGMLGNRTDFGVHPDTAGLAKTVNADSRIETGSPLLTARYLPNLKPNRKWRKDPIGQHLGRSDFDGAEDLMDALDEVYTSLMRDFRLGKSRIMVPKGMLNTLGPGQGAQFNADQEVFTELGEQVGSLNMNASGGSAESFIKTFQPAIRQTEHQDAVVHLLERIYAACGYSAQSFGEAGDTAITATEVTSREKLTLLTRAAKILVARPEIALLLAALMDVDEYIFSGPGRDGLLPTIEFPDAASDSPQVLAQTLSLLNTAEAVSIKTRVEMLHPDWDETQIDEEVQAIREDYSMIPMPSEKNLWAAIAESGSNTGGAPTQAAVADEEAVDGDAGAPVPA